MNCDRCGQRVARLRAGSQFIIVDPFPYFYTALEVRAGVKEVYTINGLSSRKLNENSFGFMLHSYFCKGKI